MQSHFNCKTTDEAKQILRNNNIKFDNIYRNLFPEKTLSGEIVLSSKNSVHIYINNGKCLNVAYFTPIMNLLTIIERLDATPENRKQYI